MCTACNTAMQGISNSKLGYKDWPWTENHQGLTFQDQLQPGISPCSCDLPVSTGLQITTRFNLVNLVAPSGQRALFQPAIAMHLSFKVSGHSLSPRGSQRLSYVQPCIVRRIECSASSGAQTSSSSTLKLQIGFLACVLAAASGFPLRT